MKPCVLTIAGFDPSGGAGIQADLRVFAALGLPGLSAATALTAQNGRGVRSVHPVAPAILQAQLESVLSDANVAAVKIGMLGGAEQVRIVARALDRARPAHVVLDPVLASTGGFPLLDPPGQRALIAELLPRCSLVTPNLRETAALTGIAATPATAGWTLLSRGAGAALIKGGHLAGAPDDVLFRKGRAPTVYPGVRVPTSHTHGTGCLLSSAIAAYLAAGHELAAAVGLAKTLVASALRSPVAAAGGRGYPDVLAAAGAASQRSHDRRLARLEGLYALADTSAPASGGAEGIARAALAAGARVIQLRDKRLATPELVRLAKRLNALARSQDALFIVNDRVDVALAADADGVHLGPADMSPLDARRLLGPARLIGVSVATIVEARRARPAASYFGVGAIFGSKTKLDAGPPVGLDRVRQIRRAFPGLPIVAIGGIRSENAAAVMRAGAAAVASISAIAGAANMKMAARALAAACCLQARPAAARACGADGRRRP